MSILNVNTIQPVGSGQTITVSAANISAPSTVISASNFVGNVTGNLTSGVLSGISTLGVATAYITQLAGVGAGTSIQVLSGSRLVGLTTGSIYAPGNVLQVVQATITTQSANSNVATNAIFDLLSANITPTSSSSKILILSSFQIWMQPSAATTFYGRGHLRRGTTDLYSTGGPQAENVIGSISEWGHRHNVQWLDSPNTTSQVTYTFRWTHDVPNPILNLVFHRNGSPGVLTLIEIAG